MNTHRVMLALVASMTEGDGDLALKLAVFARSHLVILGEQSSTRDPS